MTGQEIPHGRTRNTAGQEKPQGRTRKLNTNLNQNVYMQK